MSNMPWCGLSAMTVVDDDSLSALLASTAGAAGNNTNGCATLQAVWADRGFSVGLPRHRTAPYSGYRR